MGKYFVGDGSVDVDVMDYAPRRRCTQLLVIVTTPGAFYIGRVSSFPLNGEENS